MTTVIYRTAWLIGMKIWHKHLGREDVGFYVIKIRELQDFLPINLPFLFMHIHWDLETHMSDWDEIWHELFKWVGVFYLSIFSFMYNHWEDWDEIWHAQLVWDEYQFIILLNFELAYFVYLSFFSMHEH